MQLVGEGGMIELYIPYKLGYGDGGGGPIPPKPICTLLSS